MSLSIAKRYPLSFKAAPSPQPNLKSNIVTGLLLLLGEKGEKNYCKKKTCHLLQSVLKCKMKPNVKNIEIICFYKIRPRVCIKIVRFLSPTKPATNHKRPNKGKFYREV